MSDIPFLIGTLVLVFNICFWTNRLREALLSVTRVPELTADSPVPLPLSPPMISVIVPAHNEEGPIQHSLESVLAQDYPYMELIAVDDRSTDGTLAVMRSLAERHPSMMIVENNGLPPGWTGKCYALHLGVQKAGGQWLAFLDADSAIRPSTLRQCIHTAQGAGASMITLTPGIAVHSFWDGALMPLLAGMQYILYPLARVNDPDDPTASANGMFYLINGDAYNRIGGHESVKDLAVEDIGIGKRVKSAGLGLIFANGKNLLKTHMYDSVSGILHGWARIFAASINYSFSTALKHFLIHIMVSLPILALGIAAYLPIALEFLSLFAFIPLVMLGIEIVIVTSFLYRGVGIPLRYSAFMFLSNLMVVITLALVAKNIFCHAPLEWRGSVYENNRYEPKNLDPPT